MVENRATLPVRVNKHRASPTQAEQRRHLRRPLGHYLSVALPGWPEFAAWGRDISRGGVGLAIDRPMALGDRLLFGLRAADGTVQRLEAEVCNVCWKAEEQRCWVGLRWLADHGATADLLGRLFGSLPKPGSASS